MRNGEMEIVDSKALQLRNRPSPEATFEMGMTRDPR
jgi:hypothetical protein